MPYSRFPTEKQVRKGMGLPANAKFLGWADHLPESGEFLAAQGGSPDAMLSVFAQGPSGAKRFVSAAAAGAIVTRQTRAAVVVAIFDRGEDYAVIDVAGNQHSRFAD